MLGDHQIEDNFYCDHGIAAQSILLGAVEKGFGGCIIASVERNKLRENFQIEKRFEILQVIALGKPRETVIIEEMKTDEDIQYWRSLYYSCAKFWVDARRRKPTTVVAYFGFVSLWHNLSFWKQQICLPY